MCCFHFWTSIISLWVYHPHREILEASEPPSLTTYLILQSATTQTVKFKPQILSQHQLETHGASFRNPQNQATHKTRDLVASMQCIQCHLRWLSFFHHPLLLLQRGRRYPWNMQICELHISQRPHKYTRCLFSSSQVLLQIHPAYLTDKV